MFPWKRAGKNPVFNDEITRNDDTTIELEPDYEIDEDDTHLQVVPDIHVEGSDNVPPPDQFAASRANGDKGREALERSPSNGGGGDNEYFENEARSGANGKHSLSVIDEEISTQGQDNEGFQRTGGGDKAVDSFSPIAVQIQDDKDDEDVQNFLRQRRASHFGGKHRHKRKMSKMENGKLSVSRSALPGSNGHGQVISADEEENNEDAQTEEEIFENIKLQKEIIENVRKQPWCMRKKLKALKMAKEYVEKHEGALSLSHGYQQAGYQAWQRFKRFCTETVVVLTPWEMRIKRIESHFGSVVSSYFIFIRWMVWLNICLAVLTFAFIILPAVFVGNDDSPGKMIPKEEQATAQDLTTLWDFGGIFKYSPLFYGWYGSTETIGNGYRLPLAYLLAGLSTYIISFVLVLRRMAANARLNKATSDDEHYTFCWKLFSSWDCSIGSTDTAKNKIAEICTVIKEAVLDVQEKEKDQSNKRLLIFLRVIANLLVLVVLAASTYLIYTVVERSREFELIAKSGERQLNWWEVNEVSIVMSLVTTLFPSLFDLIGMMEKYHPRTYLRWQLARIFALYLLNLYTLYIALFYKITAMEEQIKSIAKQTSIDTSLQSLCDLQNGTDLARNISLTGGWNGTNCSGVVGAGRLNMNRDSICWETMVGQEIVKLTNFDLIFTVAAVLLIDFVRGLVVRYCNTCCCWDLEMKFPEYGEFKIAENILHIIYNQGMIWLGTFFSPALPAINIVKLLILLYIRSWAVLMCNIPHERVFKVSRSNNFYYFLTLVMLFLCTLPVGYAITAITPSKDCGPFTNETEAMYKLLSRTIDEQFPQLLVDIINYMSSPGILIPLFILLVMIIYYLITLSGSLKEVLKDLKIQLHYERTEEKKKVYAMADSRNSAGGSSNKTDNAITEQPGKARPLKPEEVAQAKLRVQYMAHIQALNLIKAQQRQLEMHLQAMQLKQTTPNDSPRRMPTNAKHLRGRTS